jgi:hypothetical protein
MVNYAFKGAAFFFLRQPSKPNAQHRVPQSAVKEKDWDGAAAA